jgi:hypothetical protein
MPKNVATFGDRKAASQAFAISVFALFAPDFA